VAPTQYIAAARAPLGDVVLCVLLLLSSATSAPAALPSGSGTWRLQLAGDMLRHGLLGGLKKEMLIHSLSNIRGDDDDNGIPAGATWQDQSTARSCQSDS